MRLELQASKLTQTAGALADARQLFDVSLHWSGPSLHTIMGASGSGKSSFLKTLGGVWAQKSGSLSIGGIDFHSPEGIILRRTYIGFAFQNNALFSSLSVLENLCFPHRLRFPEFSESERTQIARSWLERVELLPAEKQQPHELSGGMQKRLGIARALILNPKFLFLDDPTAGLDPITSRTIAELVISLLKESASLSVLVTNDRDRYRQWGGELHFLENGRLISANDPDFAQAVEEFR